MLEWTVLTLSVFLLCFIPLKCNSGKTIRPFKELHYDKTPCSDGKRFYKTSST